MFGVLLVVRDFADRSPDLDGENRSAAEKHAVDLIEADVLHAARRVGLKNVTPTSSTSR